MRRWYWVLVLIGALVAAVTGLAWSGSVRDNL